MTLDIVQLKRWLTKRVSPHTVGVLIALATLAGTLTVRHHGWFQFLEFYVYDLFIRHQAPAESAAPIVLVEMTEADIHSPSLDYPIHDDKLARLLEVLAACRPAVIGLDIWRDIPVPKNGAGQAQFNRVLETYPNIVGIFTLGGIAPPSVLKGDTQRIAFNDNFPVDVGVEQTVPKVRRSLLFVETSPGQVFDAFPFSLAVRYLHEQGIVAGPDAEDPKSFRLGKARFRSLEANDGAYVGADTRGWQILLDFRTRDQFVSYSVTQALAGRIPQSALQGKIVLIGINTPSVSDERVTPVSRDHRGVRLQAMTIDQLVRQALNGDPTLRYWTEATEDAWVFFWCLLGGAIGYWVRSPWWFAGTSPAGLVGLGTLAWAAFVGGWWIPVIAPAAGFACAAALVTSYVSFRERQMRSVLMKLYSRHVSREIAESVWANRDSFLDGHRPLAQKLIVTVLFTDLKGFSTIAESMEASRLYVWLNGYLGAMARIIQDHGGVLKQFTGDGILALFGVPIPHTTLAEQSGDAAASVRCALAMGNRLLKLSREWQGEGLPEVSMRVGIYTGEVAAGSVGSDDRFEYAVVGDVVNTAARLETFDKTIADPDFLPNRCRILVGAPTFELVRGQFLSREIGLLEVKGKVTKVSVHQILDETAAVADP